MKTSPQKQAASSYTAVVYAHGIGSQRRFQETGRLIDALDAYQHSMPKDEADHPGQLVGIRAREETWHPEVKAAHGASGHVPFVQVIHTRADGSPEQEVRFYEIYWADLMDEASVADVLTWIGMQALRPFRWWRAPWRSFHRLRRAVLAELYEAAMERGETEAAGEMGRLLVLYGAFDELAAKRRYPGGSFQDFLAFIAEEVSDDAEARRRLTARAQDWGRAERRAELGNAFSILSLIVALAVTFAGLVWSLAQALGLLRSLLTDASDSAAASGLMSFLPEPTWASLAGVAGTLVLALGVRGFLARSLSDVAAWTTYAEAERGYRQRKAVLEAGRSVLQQVLMDKACKRVVVIGHSLGTSVACDTILYLARANRVRASTGGKPPPDVPLQPISHLVTLASPIDKINYFFERHVASHRFARVLEALRGDLGDPPFTPTRGAEGLRWINFWDEADPISGPLHSPVSRESLEPRIENIHVPGLHFPLPGQAHSAYFQNRTVIGILFDAIFRPEAMRPRAKAPGPLPYGLGAQRGAARDIYWLGLAVPWLILLAMAAYALEWTDLVWAAGGGAVALAAMLFLGFLFRRRGSREPL
jgi:hypothetical protein